VDVGKKNNFETTNLFVHTGVIASCYTETGKYDSAIYYYQLTLDFPEQNQSIKTLKHEFKRRLALIYLGMGKTDSAIYYLTDTYEWFSKAGFLMQSQLAALHLGETYLRMKEISKADFYFKRSEELLDEQLMKKSFFRYDSLKYTVSFGWEIWGPISIKYMKEFIYNRAVEFYNKMYRYSKERGLTEPYLRYIEAYTLARDTLVKIERKRELIEVQTRFESEQKDKEIQSLSQENELKELQIKQTRFILFGLGGVLLIGIAFVILFMRQKKLKEEQEKSNLQNKLYI